MVAEKHQVTTLEDKRDEEKKEWLKTSFWAPDNTPMVNDSKIEAPSKKHYCPAVALEDKDGKHQIKMKELISLRMDENDLHEYICWTCQKPLGLQKIGVMKRCGHAMCKTCIT